jgi:hypothetical protein
MKMKIPSISSLLRTIILHLEEYVADSDGNWQKIAIRNLIKIF